MSPCRVKDLFHLFSKLPQISGAYLISHPKRAGLLNIGGWGELLKITYFRRNSQFAKLNNYINN